MTAPDPELQELACMEAIELIRADHQRTVDELLAMAERLEALCSSHAAKVGPQHAWWDDIFAARALIAKHRKGGA